jgi:hypothetical protein
VAVTNKSTRWHQKIVVKGTIELVLWHPPLLGGGMEEYEKKL